MSLGRVLFDSAVLIYAVGADHPYREPCRALVGAPPDVLRAEASVLAVEEFLHQRARRTGDRIEAAARAADVAVAVRVHDLSGDDLELALALYRSVPALDAADACHAATALRREVPIIVSPDRAFDDVDGLQRLDPAVAAARLDA